MTGSSAPSVEAKRKLLNYLKRWVKNRIYTRLESIRFDKIIDFYNFASDFTQGKDSKVYLSNDPEIRANQIYFQEEKNFNKTKLIYGPYKQISIIYPCESLEEAITRGINWKLYKINSRRELYEGDPNPQVIEIDLENINGSVNQEGPTGAVFVLKETVSSVGVRRHTTLQF